MKKADFWKELFIGKGLVQREALLGDEALSLVLSKPGSIS